MAIAARTATKGTATSGGAFTVTFANGSAAGDVVVLFVANAGTAGPAAPVGWTRYRNADSAGTGQSITTFTAPWSAGLTGSFTNAASVAAWACNSYSGANSVAMTDGAGAVTSSTTNNTTLPTGAPTTGAVAGDYEVLGYAFTSAATISGVAAGSTIDATQANSTSISAVLGHNNTTSLGASTATTAFSQTLSASNTRKTGVGVLLQALNPQAVAPATGSLTLTGATPAIVLGTRLTPATASLTLTGATPAVASTANVSAAPTTGTLTLTGATPTVTKTSNVFVTPATASLTLTGATPTVATPILVSPAALALALAGATPGLVLGTKVAPSTATLTLAGATPTVATPIAVNPSALALALTGATPSVAATARVAVAPGPLALALTGSTPTVTVPGGQPVSVAPGRLLLTLTGSVPIVAGADAPLSFGPISNPIRKAVMEPPLEQPTFEVEDEEWFLFPDDSLF